MVRSQNQIERDRARVAELSLQGYTNVEIAGILSSENGYKVTPNNVKYDLDKVRKGWLATQRQTYNALVAQDLHRIEVLENEAWRAWRSSIEGSTSITIERVARIVEDGLSNGEQPDMIVSKIKETTVAGGAGNPAFLDQIIKIQQERRKVTGVYAPSKFGIDINKKTELLIKGYGQVSPNDWPDPKAPKLGDGVIDGEYE